MRPKYKNISIILVCFVLLLLSAKSIALAQDAETKVAAVGQTPESSESDVTTSKIGRWAVSISKTDNGTTQVEIRLEANEPYTTSDGKDLNIADFVIGCTRGQTVAFLDWKARLTNDDNEASTMNISYSLDDTPPVNSDWNISADKKSLISKRSIEFIRSLSGKKRMEMVLAPDGLGHETLIFTLGNLDDVLKLVGDQCYN